LILHCVCVFPVDQTLIYLHSGYDFGYLLKVLTDSPLPEEEEEFFAMIKLYFHNIYDVKYLMKSCKNLKGGLQEVAEQLEVRSGYIRAIKTCFRPNMWPIVFQAKDEF